MINAQYAKADEDASTSEGLLRAGLKPGEDITRLRAFLTKS